MKIITKHYSGEQDGYLYPRAQEIGGVSGDSDACKIYFKLPKQFDTTWGKMIVFDGELYDPVTKQYIPMEYNLASDNSFTIPSEITDQYRGKTINYHLVLNEIGTDTTILSHSSALYFSKSAKNTNVVTYLATHAFVDADFAVDETKDRPTIRFFRTEGNPDVKLTLDVPYLDLDGKIPKQFIDVDKYSVNVFEINNPTELITLSDALVGDWAKIATNAFEGQMYMLTKEPYNVADNWVLIYTDSPLFTDVRTNGLTVLTGANLDYISGKVLCTNADGDIIGSDTTSDELKQLRGIRTDKTVQQQIDNKIELVDEATETGGKACFAPFGMTPDFSNPELVTVKVDKVRLSKNPSPTYSRVDSIDIPIPRAYVENDNPITGTNTAGLYTKGLADKKVDVFQGTGYAEKGIIVGADGYIKPGEFKLRDACELQKITTTSSRTPGDSTVYTAGKSDITFIKLLGNEDVSGEPYHIPFNINSIVQEATQISTTFDTITLDNAKTKKSYPIIIPSADIANNKAGLYTKAMAVAKLDVEKTDGSFTSKITNNGNNIAGIITESGADRSQVIQNANDFSAYITDGTDKAELIITKDSAYLQKGSEAGVTIQPGQEIVRKDALDLKVDRTVKDAQNAHDTIDNSYSQNGCVMQTQLDDADRTIVSFNTASENGATGILAQICAKRTTGADAEKGMRLNFTRDGAYYGVGDATPPDADHEIATIGGTVKVGNELTTGEIDTLIGVW